MNDPNGMVYFNGEYHLFYQHNPESAAPGSMHWGHAVSTNMIHWDYLPIALYPDENGVIYSGSAVVDWEDTSGFFDGKPGLVAIFTHHDRDPETDQVRERQSLAYSVDSGRTWIKYSGNPVLESDRFVDFRDPKVFWHSDTKRWVMVLATGRTVSLYHSSNLKEWTFSSEFGQGNGVCDGVWECPDLFPLPVDGDSSVIKWVMLVSVGGRNEHPEGSMTQYFIGEFDGQFFVNDNAADTVLRLDHGRDNYAGVSWSDIPDEDGRRIFLAWMSNLRYCTVTPTEGWRSAMTIPRTLELTYRHGQICLIQNPIHELETIRTAVLSLKDTTLEEARRQFAGLELDSFEMIVELDSNNKEDFTIKVRASDSQYTDIGYDARQNEIGVDRSLSGRFDFHQELSGTHKVKLMTVNEAIKLHIFVDRSSIELFVNDGIAVITDLIFPEPSSIRLGLHAAGENIQFQRIEIYKLG